ncbi:MAG: hypothetical protein ACRDLM_10520 [Gaiellaceae bacterium]
MRRLLPVALLLALVLAAPAVAKVPKTAIGSIDPIAVYATVTPPVQTFGDAITARVTVLADRRLVSPTGIRVITGFAPYQQVKPPTRVRTVSGHLLEETWTWSLRCLTQACVPVVPPSDVFHVFRFKPVDVRYRGAGGTLTKIHVFFPPVEELSQVSPGIVNYLETRKIVNWQYQLTPGTAARYRTPPGLVFWAAVVLAAVLGAAGLVLAGRWALRFRAPAALAAPALPASYLERALALFFWATAHGDETLQRKALERVAGELPLDVIDLSDATRELAWSPETPEGDEVEAISERAGVPAHHEDGAGG